MTTILADATHGVMVSDSYLTDEDRTWSVRKVFRMRGALVATSGDAHQGEEFFAWYRAGADQPPDFLFDDACALVLTPRGLFLFDENVLGLARVPSGREAIGSGAKAAMAAYHALGFADPRQAVRIACRYDANSRPPVRLYRI